MQLQALFINICLALFVVYFYKKIRHGLHILQLENYYNDRYSYWMKNNLKTVLSVRAIGLMIIPIVLFVFGKTKIVLFII